MMMKKVIHTILRVQAKIIIIILIANLSLATAQARTTATIDIGDIENIRENIGIIKIDLSQRETIVDMCRSIVTRKESITSILRIRNNHVKINSCLIKSTYRSNNNCCNSNIWCLSLSIHINNCFCNNNLLCSSKCFYSPRYQFNHLSSSQILYNHL